MRASYLNVVWPLLLMLCGCNQEIRTNTEKTNALVQQLLAGQQEQARELAALKSQLAVLPIQWDKTQLDYFVRGQEKALFYQTNALFLLLAVDKKIESQFEVAAAAREQAMQQAFTFHTNETDLAVFTAGQIAGAMAAQEKRLLEEFNGGIRRATTALANDLTNQLKALAANPAETARAQALAAQVLRLQADLDQIKARLGVTNTLSVPQH